MSTLPVIPQIDIDTATGLCREMPFTVPEWIELIPSGAMVKGIDGRAWRNDQPAAVLDYLKSRNHDLVLDWEHSTEIRSPKGSTAPAAAWFKEFKIENDGSIWGKPEWTERGRNSVQSREYRYISPAIVYQKSNNQIVGISSVGLTNSPNLSLTALNRAFNPMSLQEALITTLHLAPAATDEQIIHGVATALNRADNPPLDKFVPRGELETALNRARTAEQKLSDIEKSIQETAINAVLDKHKTQYTPAKRDHYMALCRQQGGIELFEKIMDGMPEIGGDSGLDGKTPPGSSGVSLNSDQIKIAQMFGHTPADLAKYLGEIIK